MRITRLFIYFCVMSAMLLTSGCYYLQSTKVPIETMWYKTPGSDTLFILLPGIGDGADAYAKHGFIARLQEQFRGNTSCDVVAVNAHLKYYLSETLIERLQQDVVEPAKRGGYKKIYMAGISLGGFGTLLYLRDHPDDLTSVVLLAPYLGEQEYYKHLLDGEPQPAAAVAEKKNIWPWLEAMPKQIRNKIFLGYGEQDKFAQPDELLAALLPDGHTLTVPGIHNWATWEQLWPELLARLKAADTD